MAPFSFTLKQKEGNLSSSQFFSELSIYFILHCSYFVSDNATFTLTFTFTFTFTFFIQISLYVQLLLQMQTPLKKGRNMTPDILSLKMTRAF
jgi:hypothetical protein